MGRFCRAQESGCVGTRLKFGFRDSGGHTLLSRNPCAGDSLIDYLEAGNSLAKFLDNFPSVSRGSYSRARGSEGGSHQLAMRILLDENLPRKLAGHLEPK